jgi:hypothetical protein
MDIVDITVNTSNDLAIRTACFFFLVVLFLALYVLWCVSCFIRKKNSIALGVCDGNVLTC